MPRGASRRRLLASEFRRREAPFIEIRVNRVPSFTIVSCEKPPPEKSRGGFLLSLPRSPLLERAALTLIFGRCARRPDRPFFDTKA
jgi:hypothetical protein